MPELVPGLKAIGGAFGVDENARRLIHYKFAENVCMTTAGGWASSSPSIKVKFALGRHCYEDSVHSLWLGQRLPELRVTEDVESGMPPTLRWAFSRLPMHEEERSRLERETFEAKGFFSEVERLLVTVDDSANGKLAVHLRV